MLVEISPAEFFDKISILEIKAERIGDPEKIANVRFELDVLRLVKEPLPNEKLSRLRADLKSVNELIWDAGDAMEDCERASKFGSRFIEAARDLQHHNDRRSRVKRDINVLFQSQIFEEKSYGS